MAKIEMWGCDVCGDEFRKSSLTMTSYNDRHGISVIIGNETSMYDPDDKYELSLNDTCASCRDSLRKLVTKWFADRTGE